MAVSQSTKRPTIIVDLDNVLYDWARAMGWWLLENGVRTDVKDYKTWEVWNDWGISKGEFIRWWRLGIEAGEIYGKGPVISGGRDALWRLSDAEWNIHIVSNRLSKFGLHDTIAINTAMWLRDNNIPYRQLSLVADKTRISADAIVDDRQDNMNPDVHGRCYVFPANHNRGEYVSHEQQREAWQNIYMELVNFAEATVS